RTDRICAPASSRCGAHSGGLQGLERPLARDAWKGRRMTQPPTLRVIEGETADVREPFERPPAFTDEALALAFAEQHQQDLRYVAAWGRWLHWDGTRWEFDNTMIAFAFARKICRQASVECNNEKVAKVLASAKTVAAVHSLARADRRLAATIDQWDAD